MFIRDLFVRKESLCHCVSQDLVMSKGIAVRFRDQLGGIDELNAQGPTVGGMCVLPFEHGSVPPFSCPPNVSKIIRNPLLPLTYVQVRVLSHYKSSVLPQTDL